MNPEEERVIFLAGTIVVAVLLASPWLPLSAGAGAPSSSKGSAATQQGDSPVSTLGLQTPTSYPVGITTDGNGNVWFAEDSTDSLGEYILSNSTFETFRIPTQHHLAWIWFMVFDGGGNLWFSDESQQMIWRFDPATKAFANFTSGSAYPLALRYDPARSRLWFTSLKTGQVGYFVLGGGLAQLGKVANLTAPLPGTGLSGIDLDQAGNAFVAESFQAKIVELNGTTLAVTRTWTLPSGSEPVGLAYDASRGRLWFTNHASSFFGFVELGSTRYVEYSTSLLFSEGDYEVTLPYWIDVSTSGYVWFNEHIANRIARFDPGRMQLTEFDIPTNNSSPLMLTADDDRGMVWFTEFAGNAIGKVLENSSLSQTVQVSEQTANLNPSSSLTATPEPAGPSPSVSLTSGVTGSPEPDFEVSTRTAGSAYQVEITAREAKPGNYTGAICFQFNSTSQCGFFRVVVPRPGSALSLLYAAYAAAAGGVAVLLIALLWESRRRPPLRTWPR